MAEATAHPVAGPTHTAPGRLPGTRAGIGLSLALLGALLGAVMGLAFQAEAAAPTLGDVRLLSAPGVNGYEPRVARYGDLVVAVWEQWDGGIAATAKVYRAYSTNGGETWSPRRKVYRFGGQQHAPDVAVYGNRVYVVFTMQVGSESQIQFAYSTNGGKTFSTPGTIGFGFGAAEILRDRPRVAAYRMKAWAAWANGDVYVRRSLDGGESFGAPMPVESSAAVESDQARIANDGNNVYVVHEALSPGDMGPAIWFHKSTDAATSFGALQELVAPGSGALPEVAAFGRRITLAYSGGGLMDVLVRHSNNRGGGFSPAREVSGARPAGNPSVAIDRYRSYVAWTELGGLVARASNAAGTTWTARKMIAGGPAMVMTATAASGKEALFAWTQVKNQRTRIYARPARY